MRDTTIGCILLSVVDNQRVRDTTRESMRDTTRESIRNTTSESMRETTHVCEKYN